MDRVGDPVHPVDGDHGVGGLGGDGCAGRAHRDAEVGERQRGRVVDAVADHDHRAQIGIGAQTLDDLELLLGGLLGVDAVDAELATDPLRDRTAISGHHRYVANALGAQSLDDPIGVRAQLVGHHDHARRGGRRRRRARVPRRSPGRS